MATDTRLARLQAALDRRASLAADSSTTAYRLINRAADGFPDLAVDRYGSVLVAHVYSRGRPVPPPTRLLRALAGHTGARAVYVKFRPEQASALSDSAREALAPSAPVLGDPVDEAEVLEDGLRYLIRPGEGLSAGLFLDMRVTRAWVRAHAAGRSVLNCFAYTCAFGVAAQAGGARRAVNLDLSRRYLDWGKRNTELNGLPAAPTDFIFGDVFDWLRRLARAGQRFDLVILDPPSYATSRHTRFAVERDYARLVALAAPAVAPGGWLLACANTQSVTRRALLAQIHAGLAGHPARVTRVAHEPALDFPTAPGAEPYLKVCFVHFAAA